MNLPDVPHGAQTLNPAADVLLEARDVSRHDTSGRALVANVSLQIPRGTRSVLTGPTGSGKSVLLRLLAALDEPSGGSILWRDRPVLDSDIPNFRRDVCYLHQTPVLIDGTVEDNLRLPLTFAAHRQRSFDRDRCLLLLQSFRRDATFFSQSARALSGGEQQIVALIRCLQLEPSVLLLDEPTSALDGVTVRLFESVMLAWIDEPGTSRALVWVSHDIEQIRRLDGETVTMEYGQRTT